MSSRAQLMSFAAFTVLVAFSGVSRADDYSIPNTERFARSEERSQPMTCAQATAFAWFKHQMELSDGGFDSNVAAPVECERTYVATGVDVRDATEESK